MTSNESVWLACTCYMYKTHYIGSYTSTKVSLPRSPGRFLANDHLHPSIIYIYVELVLIIDQLKRSAT